MPLGVAAASSRFNGCSADKESRIGALVISCISSSSPSPLLRLWLPAAQEKNCVCFSFVALFVPAARSIRSTTARPAADAQVIRKGGGTLAGWG